MSSIDLFSHIKASNAFTTASITSNTDTDTLGVNVVGFESNVVTIKTDTITDGSYAITVFDDNDSGFGAPTLVDADLVKIQKTPLTSADSDGEFKVGYVGHKDNFRIRITSTSVSTGGQFSATAIQGNPRIAPVA